jgi:hypothetical protein
MRKIVFRFLSGNLPANLQDLLPIILPGQNPLAPVP